MMEKKKHGFTLVELLVVIAILAILASVTTLGYMGFVAKANLSSDKEEASQMSRSLNYYLTSEEDYVIDDFESLNNALKMATDNTFDLETYKLRSADKGYNLWFNTKTNTFEVVKEYNELQNSEVKGAYKDNTFNYSGVEAFLWSESTPYLLAGVNANNPLAKTVKDLMVATDEAKVSKQTTFNKIDAAFKDKIMNNAYINKDGNLISLNKEVKTLSSLEKDKLLFASGVTTINEVKELTLNSKLVLPKTITKVEAGALRNVTLNSGAMVTGKETKIDSDSFKDDTLVTLPHDYNDANLSAFTGTLNIQKGDKKGTITGNELTYETGEKKDLNYEVSEDKKTNAIAWANKVSELTASIVNYDLYQGKIPTTIVNLNRDYEGLKEFEKNYLNQEYRAVVESFYHETTSGNKIVLNSTTGLYNRFVIYNEMLAILKASNVWSSNVEAFEIKTEDIDLFDLLKNGFTNDKYLIDVTVNNYNPEEINLYNLISVEAGEFDIEKRNGLETGKLLNLGFYGETTIKVTSRDNNDYINLKYHSGYGVNNMNLLIPHIDKSGEKFALPQFYVGKKNSFVIGLTINGELEQALTKEDLVITYGNGLTLADFNLTVITDDKLQYVLEINLTNESNIQVDNEYEFTVTLLGNHKFDQKIKVQVLDAINIKTEADWKSLNNQKAVLNNNLNLASNNVEGFTEGYSIKAGKLNYNKKVANPRVTFTDSSLIGNNFTIDASEFREKAVDGQDALIESKGSEISFVEIRLQDSKGYTIYNSEFSAAAAVVYTSENNTIMNNVKIHGSARGVRINATAELRNILFTSSMVPVEIYSAGGENTDRPIILQNVDIKSSIEGAGDIKNGMGILYFPGNSGDGVATMDKIKLELDNYTYDGQFTKEELAAFINQVIGGLTDRVQQKLQEKLGKLLAALVKPIVNALTSFTSEINQVYKDNNLLKLSPSILICRDFYVKAQSTEIGSHFNDFESYKNSFDLDKYHYIQADKDFDISLWIPIVGTVEGIVDVHFSLFTERTNNVYR